MSSNAGGAATNAGIDFQQRVSALFLTHMLMNIDFIDDLGLTKSAQILELKFESSNEIDDLVIKTSDGVVYIQAKRSISCSEAKGSEFYKVIQQFVSQYLKGVGANDSFVLATTSKASSKIRGDLKKIIEGIKLNEDGFGENPLNKSEQSVLNITKKVIASNYKDIANKPVTDEIVIEILRMSNISVIDIEEGMPLEKAILILISGKISIAPILFWSNLISMGLTLSKNRSSINIKGLKERIGKFVKADEQEHVITHKENFFEYQLKSTLSSGREVIIIDSFLDDADFLIVELIRFEEDGKKRLTFSNEKVELSNDEKWNVVYRASTFSGIERYIEGNESLFSESKITIIKINSDENFDESNVAKCYSDFCIGLINTNQEPLECIHCGEHISDDQSSLIEIDELDTPHQVGLVHNECLRVLDRVLGVIQSALFKENNNLKNFDYEGWYFSVVKGQGLFSSMGSLPKGANPLLWKPSYSKISKGKYCVKINLDDGSSKYVQDRGRVARETKESAAEKCLFFNESFKQSVKDKDPHCYTCRGTIFTKYSNALAIKEDDDDIFLCENAEIAILTRSIDKTYSLFDNYYTPLLIFLDKERGLPLLVNGAMVFLSNPLRLDLFIKNWSRAGVKLPEFTISMIKSDEEFDKFVTRLKEDDVEILIDPEINMKGQLTSGLILEIFDSYYRQEP